MAYFGGKSDGELEEIMKQMGFKYVWIKSRSGHPIYNSAPPEPPRERELLSIAPVLQFLLSEQPDLPVIRSADDASKPPGTPGIPPHSRCPP